MIITSRSSRLLLTAGVGLMSGCVTHQTAPWREVDSKPLATSPTIQLVSSLDQTNPDIPIQPVDFRDAAQLDLDALIGAILERNPGIEQMQSAAEAMRSRYPQVIALDDPMFGMNLAPASAWSSNADFAARAEISQKIPWSGKRDLRGQTALAEASAAGRDVDDIRLQLIEAGKSAFADYYLATRALDVSAENTKLLKEFRAHAETRYRNGQAPQQDILQADVELAKQEERAIALQRAKTLARAKINTLMHRPPDAKLPEPGDIAKETGLPDAKELREQALLNRPDLKAIADRLTGDEAALALAEREFKPDVELLAAYDGFWQGVNGRSLQWQVGARINLPVQKERRRAAVAEARAKISQRRAELARTSDQIQFQVLEAYEQYRESTKVVDLCEKTVLPAAQANVKEARVSYVSGKIPFMSLVEAQRNLVMLRDRFYEAQADTLRRRGALERMVGGTSSATDQ